MDGQAVADAALHERLDLVGGCLGGITRRPEHEEVPPHQLAHEARLAGDAIGRCFGHGDGRGGERAVLLSHSVASGDKRESAAASGDAAGRPAARTGWSAVHLPSTPDVI